MSKDRPLLSEPIKERLWKRAQECRDLASAPQTDPEDRMFRELAEWLEGTVTGID